MRNFRSAMIAAATIAALPAGGCASAPASGNVTGDYLAGRLSARVNAVDDAARIYAAAHARAPQDVAILKDAFFYRIAAGDVEGALPYAEILLREHPDQDDGLARYALAARALKYGDAEKARKMLREPMNSPFMATIAYLTDVWIVSEADGPDAALAKLGAMGPELIGAFNLLHRALLSEAAGRGDEAGAAYQAALHGGDGGGVSRRAFGAFLERAGDEAAARDYYAVIAGQDGYGRRLARDGTARLARGAASADFAQLSAVEGAALVVHAFGQEMIAEAAGQRERAELAGFRVGEPRFNLPLVLTRLALYLDPDLEEAQRLTGAILNIYGDYGQAADILAAIPPRSPHFEQARIEMVAGLVEEKKNSEAERVLRAGIRRDPGSIELKWTLANLFAEIGDKARAAKALDGVIAALPEQPEEDAWRYFVSRGGLLAELGRWPEAEADLKRAVALDPDEPTALNYLGYSWAERGVNLEEAFRLIEKAVELRPESGAIIDSLGWAHYQLGRYGEAVGHLEKAAALEPSDPTITDHLGDVYWRLGREIEARYQWRRSLEIDPPAALKAAIEEKLAKGLGPRADAKGPDGGG